MLVVLMKKFGPGVRSVCVQLLTYRAVELATRMTSVKLAVCEASSQLKGCPSSSVRQLRVQLPPDKQH